MSLDCYLGCLGQPRTLRFGGLGHMGGDVSWEEGARIKGRCPGCRRGGEKEGGVAAVSGRSCPLPLGCVAEGPAVRGRASAADGLDLIRLEPGPSASPCCLALPAPTPPPWAPADLPETLPRPKHGIGAEIREAPCAPDSVHFHSASSGFRPPPPFRAPPRTCGCLGPRLRARRVAGGFLAGGGGPCQPSTGRAGPAPQVSRPCTCQLRPRAALCSAPTRATPRPFVSASRAGGLSVPGRRTEQGRRQSYVRRGGRGGRGGGGAERGSGGAGGGEARRAGDSGGRRRRHAASRAAHRGLRRPQRRREARRPASRGRSQPGRPRTAVGAPCHGPSRGRGPGPGAAAAAAASGGHAGPRRRGRAG